MREILFRGKSMNDGEWVHGSLVITTIEPADEPPVKHYHIEDMTIGVFPNEHQSGITETVAPNTVGQYTGLTDKNGKKIFEGDIVRDDYESGVYARVAWLPQGCGWYLVYSQGDRRMGHRARGCGYQQDVLLEVIGNIHDNPELIGVTDNA